MLSLVIVCFIHCVCSCLLHCLVQCAVAYCFGFYDVFLVAHCIDNADSYTWPSTSNVFTSLLVMAFHKCQNDATGFAFATNDKRKNGTPYAVGSLMVTSGSGQAEQPCVCAYASARLLRGA